MRSSSGRLNLEDTHAAVVAELARLELRRREPPERAEDDPVADAATERAEAARASLREFTRQAWPYLEPGRPLMWGWHLDAVCEVLEAVTRGEIQHLCLELPPGSMKSLMVSVIHPSWEWSRDAGRRFLTFTYSDRNAVRDSLRMRELVSSVWYRAAFGVRFAPDQAQKTFFKTTAGGWRMSSSVGGLGTGEHPDRVIIDDPMKADEGFSAARLDQVNLWYDRTVSTRIALDPSMILVMQRLNENDLAGHLRALGGWEFVTFPMRYVPSRPATQGDRGHTADPRDPRTEAGELLWPDGIWTPEKVAREEIVLGPFGVAAQFQQVPVPEGGGLFQRAWLSQYVDAAPVDARRARGWDTAATELGGDYTVGTRIGVAPDGKVYIEDVIRGQMGPNDVDVSMRGAAKLDGYGCRIREEREGGSSGKAVTKARSISLAGYDYAEVVVTKNKVQRANPIRAQAQAGNVYIVKGDWNEEWVRELCAFPTGRHDDQVDSASCAYNALVGAASGELTWGS